MTFWPGKVSARACQCVCVRECVFGPSSELQCAGCLPVYVIFHSVCVDLLCTAKMNVPDGDVAKGAKIVTSCSVHVYRSTCTCIYMYIYCVIH